MTSPVQQHEDKDLTNQRVSIEEYLEYQGHEIGKVNSGGYAKIDDHDSLFVNLSENHFTWFAHNTGGGIFQLMSELDGISDYETQLDKLNEIKAERKAVFEPRVEAKQEKKPFDINDFEIETLSKESKQYLTEVRKIHPILVNALAKSGFLVDQKKDFTTKAGKQVTSQNLAYLWKDAYGQPVGADVQATRPSKKHTQDKHQGYWKGILPNSPAKKFGFSFKVGPKKDVPDKLVVVEAPIDAISHWQMHVKEYKQEHVQVAYLSLSGVKSSVLNQYIRQNYWDEHQERFKLPKELHFAVDNDEAGRGLVKKYGNMLETFSAFDDLEKLVDVPADLTVKDWNDQLRYGSTFETKTVPLGELEQVPMFSKPQVLEKEPVLEKTVDITDPVPEATTPKPEKAVTKELNPKGNQTFEKEVINAAMMAQSMNQAVPEMPI